VTGEAARERAAGPSTAATEPALAQALGILTRGPDEEPIPIGEPDDDEGYDEDDDDDLDDDEDGDYDED
jgi:hypothetical protein